MRLWSIMIASYIGVCVACAQDATQQEKPAEPPKQDGPKFIEAFPHVRMDIERGILEFDGFVPIDCHHPETPDVYLEVIVCTIDFREHEALVATQAKGSHIHAALLAMGLEPGSIASWRDGEPVAPSGPEVRIELIVPGMPDLPTDPREWIRSVNREQTLAAWEAERKSPSRWVFAGSEMVHRGGRDVYAADGTGQIIGMHTFGSEVIAWTTVLSHEAAVETPEWIADARIVPVVRTPVVVRISRVVQTDKAEPERNPEAEVNPQTLEVSAD